MRGISRLRQEKLRLPPGLNLVGGERQINHSTDWLAVSQMSTTPVRASASAVARASEETPFHATGFASANTSKRKLSAHDDAAGENSACRRRLLAQHTLPQFFQQRRPGSEVSAAGSGIPLDMSAAHPIAACQCPTPSVAEVCDQISPIASSSGASPLSPLRTAATPSVVGLMEESISSSQQAPPLTPPHSPQPTRRSLVCPGAPIRPRLFSPRRHHLDSEIAPIARLNFEEAPRQRPGLRLMWRSEQQA